MKDIGPQYEKDHAFKASARYHQSKYRAEVLGLPYNGYGNRLKPEDAQNLAIYYPKLGVREALRKRYPEFSLKRDGDLLRSEHIPFNIFGPISRNTTIGRDIIMKCLGLAIDAVKKIEFEYAPEPRDRYLNDMTAFDTYMECTDPDGMRIGIGIEVKYTELSYQIGKKEGMYVREKESPYWVTSRRSGLFKEPIDQSIARDDTRQIWRNHLLGVAMVMRNELDHFHSVTLFPSRNIHFAKALNLYRRALQPEAAKTIHSLTFEDYFEAIPNEGPYSEWKGYLRDRYLVTEGNRG